MILDCASVNTPLALPEGIGDAFVTVAEEILAEFLLLAAGYLVQHSFT
jgi:hypothetical protein